MTRFPGKVIDLKFSGNMPSLVLGKVGKFQPRSSSRFRDIPEKPELWMKTTPLPLIGLSHFLSGQRSGHQRSTKPKFSRFCLILIFFLPDALVKRTKGARAARKKQAIAHFLR